MKVSKIKNELLLASRITEATLDEIFSRKGLDHTWDELDATIKDDIDGAVFERVVGLIRAQAKS